MRSRSICRWLFRLLGFLTVFYDFLVVGDVLSDVRACEVFAELAFDEALRTGTKTHSPVFGHVNSIRRVPGVAFRPIDEFFMGVLFDSGADRVW